MVLKVQSSRFKVKINPETERIFGYFFYKITREPKEAFLSSHQGGWILNTTGKLRKML